MQNTEYSKYMVSCKMENIYFFNKQVELQQCANKHFPLQIYCLGIVQYLNCYIISHSDGL